MFEAHLQLYAPPSGCSVSHCSHTASLSNWLLEWAAAPPYTRVEAVNMHGMIDCEMIDCETHDTYTLTLFLAFIS